MEVNGTSLVGVSNTRYFITCIALLHDTCKIFFRAVEILKACTATGEIELLVARDNNTQREFKKLSTSLMNSSLRKNNVH